MSRVSVLVRCASALLLAVGTSAAHASAVLWTLTDVLFEDGGTASGSFIYDADTDTYSAISITTTDISLAPLATYTALVIGGDGDAALVPSAGPDLTGASLLQLVFQFPLTNAGGTVYLVDPFFPAASSFEGACLNALCTSIDFGRLMVDGGVVGTAAPIVPLPAGAVLLPSALGLLAAARRRQSRR